jgi:hypothetical protein
VICPGNTLTKSLELVEDFIGGGGPDEGELALYFLMKASILATRSLTDVNDPRRIARFVIRAKKRSTWLSQEV